MILVLLILLPDCLTGDATCVCGVCICAFTCGFVFSWFVVVFVFVWSFACLCVCLVGCVVAVLAYLQLDATV